VKLLKVKSKVQTHIISPEHLILFHIQNNPFNLTTRILSISIFFKICEKNIDGLSTIVWVSIHVRPKLPSRVRRLHQEVLPCTNFGERRPLDFGLQCEGSRGWALDFLQSNWWKSTASRPSAIAGSGPNLLQGSRYLGLDHIDN
jgi:hypothetical protein